MPRPNWHALSAQAGAHAVVSSVPHQYRNLMYGPETQMLFFRALADQSPVPVLIHNAPQMTGVDLLPETAAKLAEHPNIAGVIETGTPASRVAQIRSAAPKDFAVLAGTESQVWESLKAGANGAALAFASIAPYATIAIWEAFRTREEEAGLDWQATHFASVDPGDGYVWRARPQTRDGSERILRRTAAAAVRAGFTGCPPRNRRRVSRSERLTAATPARSMLPRHAAPVSIATRTLCRTTPARSITKVTRPGITPKRLLHAI